MKNKTSIQTDAVLKEDHDSLYESLAKYRREMLGPSIGTFRKDDSVLWFSYTEDYLAALEILINQKLEHEQMPLTNYEKNRLTIPILFVLNIQLSFALSQYFLLSIMVLTKHTVWKKYL
ncbi:hypothetical protein KC686_00625 [Candidatus Woesebacteria bacterium]|nr:hypothetical protein [Candidatus Woesebacteria bacterium]